MNEVSDILKCFSKLSIIYPPKSRKQSKWRFRGCMILYIGRSLFACFTGILSIPRLSNSYSTTQCQTEIMAMSGFSIILQFVCWAANCWYNLCGKANITKMLRKFDGIHYQIKDRLDENANLHRHQNIINGLVLSLCTISILYHSVVTIQQYSSHLDSFVDFILFASAMYLSFVMVSWLLLLVLLDCTLINLICIELARFNSVKNPWNLKFRWIYLGIYCDVGIIVSDVFGLIVLSFYIFVLELQFLQFQQHLIRRRAALSEATQMRSWFQCIYYCCQYWNLESMQEGE